ncbi:MAG: methylated-DNA--[protein]-cysteine S-methyltransferase [Lachnospiraceae bacterium]|nr:methylated-DNA--[protein]-cysteine S-methyltransferase [Lachnospiraceae bacterium]
MYFTIHKFKKLTLLIEAEEKAITRISSSLIPSTGAVNQKNLIIEQAIRELEEYFDGKRREFQVPVHLYGTDFQKNVWNALMKIPYGKVCTYKDIAKAVGNEKACRAVGMANHRNPVMIVVPCHRVIGSDGKLTGYAGGIDIKEYLLELEKRVL